MSNKEIIKNYLFSGSKEEQKEKFEIAWDIQQNLEEIKKDMRQKVVEKLVNKIKASNEFSEYDFKDLGLVGGAKWRPFCIFKKNWVLENKTMPVLSYAIEAEHYKYFDLYLGIEKQDNDVKGIPFKGNWQNTKVDIPQEWKDIFSKIYEKLNQTPKNWKTSASWIVWKNFDSYYSGMYKKDFYAEIIERGYDRAVDNDFDEIKSLKKLTEDLLDNFMESYKKGLDNNYR